LVSDIPQAGPQGASNRALKAVVIGLGVLIVIALGAVVVGVVQKSSSPRPASQPSGTAFALPKDGRIVEMQVQPDRLIVHVRTATGEEIDIVDTTDGHLVARIK
jgi:hypothetical protein